MRTMSNYTTEVRFICEVAAGYDESQERDKVHDLITAAIPKVFDFTFPIFDENYRTVLERKILMHYYTREIAFETVGLWKLKLETRLNEIMPYYNKLYNIELIDYNPLFDVDLTEDKTRQVGTATSNTLDRTDVSVKTTDTTGNTNDYSHTDVNGKELYSDTPQGTITNLAEGKYLTNATVNANDNTVNANQASADQSNTNGNNTRSDVQAGTIDTTDDYLKHIVGKRGGLTYSKMLEEEVALRDKIGNIDMRIIRDLKDLFFTLY